MFGHRHRDALSAEAQRERLISVQRETHSLLADILRVLKHETVVDFSDVELPENVAHYAEGDRW